MHSVTCSLALASGQLRFDVCLTTGIPLVALLRKDRELHGVLGRLTAELHSCSRFPMIVANSKIKSSPSSFTVPLYTLVPPWQSR